MKVGPEVSVEKGEYIFNLHHQNVGQNHSIKTVNTSFENMEKLKYFGTTLRIEQKTKFGEFLVLFSSESSVILSAV